jgi:hypothetical protein
MIRDNFEYLLPKGEHITVGIQKQIREQVREYAHLQAGPDPQLPSLKRTG